MKKFIGALLLWVNVISFADYYVVHTGYDRLSNVDSGHPEIAVLFDTTDKKYDIYRVSETHGYWLYKGETLTQKDLKRKDHNGWPFYKIFTLNGKKYINLTEQQMYDILQNIAFENIDDPYSE
ncbi:hypothetical protein LDJ98_04545 [Fusobacterium nucleatum]|uniref:hypothetical protein n=1 Tax=Fusobacterium nucleatum TaxID=851 RepID=UPI0030D4AE61